MGVCMCGFCDMWVCVCVGFVMCGCFGNMRTCIYCVLYCLYMVTDEQEMIGKEAV